MSLSKNKIKYIRSLELKKNRRNEGVFVAEGPKLIDDLLGAFKCKFIAATDEWLSKNKAIVCDEIVTINSDELAKISFLKSPQQVLAIFEQKQYSYDADILNKELCLALDGVQDPGNLGTIIRIADWFGIENIFCSNETVDAYNPKTVQATMGALARVKVHYTELSDLIGGCGSAAVYGTFLEGENIYQQKLSANGLIIMGNEGNGITEELKQKVNRKLYIPNYPMNRDTSESLNVAVATAIACAEFRRQAAY